MFIRGGSKKRTVKEMITSYGEIDRQGSLLRLGWMLHSMFAVRNNDTYLRNSLPF